MPKNPTNRELMLKIETLCKLQKQGFRHVDQRINEITELKKDIKKNTHFRWAHLAVYSFIGFLIGTYSVIKSWWGN